LYFGLSLCVIPSARHAASAGSFWIEACLKSDAAVLIALDQPAAPAVVVIRDVVSAEPADSVGKDERAGPHEAKEQGEEGFH
jgi:hypothetical protein